MMDPRLQSRLIAPDVPSSTLSTPYPLVPFSATSISCFLSVYDGLLCGWNDGYLFVHRSRDFLVLSAPFSHPLPPTTLFCGHLKHAIYRAFLPHTAFVRKLQQFFNSVSANTAPWERAVYFRTFRWILLRIYLAVLFAHIFGAVCCTSPRTSSSGILLCRAREEWLEGSIFSIYCLIKRGS